MTEKFVNNEKYIFRILASWKTPDMKIEKFEQKNQRPEVHTYTFQKQTWVHMKTIFSESDHVIFTVSNFFPDFDFLSNLNKSSGSQAYICIQFFLKSRFVLINNKTFWNTDNFDRLISWLLFYIIIWQICHTWLGPENIDQSFQRVRPGFIKVVKFRLLLENKGLLDRKDFLQ